MRQQGQQVGIYIRKWKEIIVKCKPFFLIQAGMISAYPRQLESLIRLSEAFAKMRLSGEVTEADVEMAYS